MNNDPIRLKQTEPPLRLSSAGAMDDMQNYEGQVGLIPEGWEVLRLGQIFQLEYGKGLPERKRDNNGFPVYGSNGTVGHHSMYQVKGPVIIVGRKGSAGEVIYSNENCWPIDTTYYIRTSNNYDLKFLYYLLLTLNLKHLENSSAIPGLNRNHVYDLLVALPPLHEQIKIAEVLGALDEKIELNRKMNKTLESLGQAIYNHMFYHSGLACPSKLQRSGDPESIPMGWKAGTIGDEFDITMGQSPPGNTYNNLKDGLPFYQGRTDFGPRFPTIRMYCNKPQRVAEQYQTIISVRAPVGDINIAKEKCCIGRGCAAIGHKVSSSYAFYKTKSLQEQLKSFDSEGTIFGSVSKTDVGNIKTVIPPLESVDEFERIIRPVDDQILNLTEEIEALSQLRDSLLPRLMSGKLRAGC